MIRPNRTFLILIMTFTFLLENAWAANLTRNPEEETLLLSKRLKPIANAEWSSIAGNRLTEKYTIARGDTLSDISKRLFGDPKYWPKLWSINNLSITNPHKIHPGLLIAFSPGTGDSLPTVSLSAENNSTLSDSESALSTGNARSTQWKNLPHQSWEEFNIQTPAGVDPLGFDESNKISFARKSNAFEPQAISTSEKIDYLAQIVGSHSESNYLAMQDEVYIRADQTIQIGMTYAITREPYLLKSRKSDRVGYSYPILGKVKILTVRDRLFIGTLLSARDFVARGDSLIALPEKIKDLQPIPAPNSVQGVIIFDHEFSTYTTAQFKEVFIDRGSNDGVKPGMVFRVYEHLDPSNEKKVTSSNFIIDADIIVTQVSAQFSTGVILASRGVIFEGSTAVLLTDVSDVGKNSGFKQNGGPSGKTDLDELDKLDNQEGLGNEEKKELKQLEEWKKNPETSVPPPPADGSPPAPPETEKATPPPQTPPPEAEKETPPPPPPAENEAAAPPPPPSEPETTQKTAPKLENETSHENLEKPPETSNSIPPPPGAEPGASEGPAQNAADIPPPPTD